MHTAWPRHLAAKGQFIVCLIRGFVLPIRRPKSCWICFAAILRKRIGQTVRPHLVADPQGLTCSEISICRTVIQDVLTIRADRDRYYYGVNDLFRLQPDVVPWFAATDPEQTEVDD